jgi:hypothetical protein
MANGKKDSKGKESKQKEKLKKEQKALKKLVKAQVKKEKELDKREKKLNKKAKQLQAREDEFFELMNNEQNEATDAIHEAIVNSIPASPSRSVSQKGPLKQSGSRSKKLNELKSAEEQKEKNKSRTRKKPSDSVNPNNKTEGPIEENNSLKTSNDYTVRQGFSLIRKMENEQEIHDFLNGDERKTMQDAGERRIKQLKS